MGTTGSANSSLRFAEPALWANEMSILKIIILYVKSKVNYLSISQNLDLKDTISIEFVPNPSGARERREAEIRSDRLKKLAELESVAQNNQMVALRKAIEVLQCHGKRLTQDGLESKSGGR